MRYRLARASATGLSSMDEDRVARRRRRARSRSRGARGRSRASAAPPGKPSSAARGARPTSSALRPRARGAATALDDLDERQLERALDVHRDLRDAAARAATPMARSPGSPCSPPSRTSAATRRASATSAGGAQLQVEGDERLARGDERRAGAAGAAPAGRSPGARAPAELGRRARERRDAAAAQLGAGAPGPLAGELAVEKTGTSSSLPMRSATTSASAHARPARAGVEIDERHDIDRADVRMRAGLRAIAARARDDVDRRRPPRARPRSSASASARWRPASVNTERWWSASLCTSSSRTRAAGRAAARPPRRALPATLASRPSETFGRRAGSVASCDEAKLRHPAGVAQLVRAAES